MLLSLHNLVTHGSEYAAAGLESCQSVRVSFLGVNKIWTETRAEREFRAFWRYYKVLVGRFVIRSSFLGVYSWALLILVPGFSFLRPPFLGVYSWALLILIPQALFLGVCSGRS